MSSKLYEKCEQCDGTRKLVKEVPTGRMIGATGVLYPEVYPVGFVCPFCRTGYHDVGLTDNQLRAILEERDRLLEFVARVAELRSVITESGRTETLAGEAGELVKGKAGRVEEIRSRLRIKPPSPPVPPTGPPG